MAVCSFLWHDQVYSTNLYNRTHHALKTLLTEHESVEILLLSSQRLLGSSFDTGLSAAVQLRSQHPKRISITLIDDKDDNGLCRKNIPACMFDRVIAPSIAIGNTKGYARRLKYFQWILQQSTHVIVNVYKELDRKLAECLRYAETLPLELIDISSAEVRAAVADGVRAMPERTRLIFQKVAENCTNAEIGRQMGIGHERVRQIYEEGIRNLQMRLNGFSRSKVDYKPVACAIFALGETTYSTLSNFKKVINYIIETRNVEHFVVEDQYCQSGFMFILEEQARCCRARITAMTTDDQNEDKTVQFCPPCDDVTYTGAADVSGLGILLDIIDCAHICVCNLMDSPASDQIQSVILQARNIMLMDIGQTM